MAENVRTLTSIVILNMNTCALLRQCIESIRKYTAKGSYELIVVDNGSSDGSVPWIVVQPDIRYIINEQNEGFPKGCNQGMAVARGTEMLLLNSDVIVTPHWLNNMKEILYMDESIGAVSCVTNYCSNGQMIEVPAELQGNVAAIADFGERYNTSRPRRVSLRSTLVGFCFLFRSKLYRQLGGLDEAFSPGNYEDDDYSLRILKSGLKLICCEDTFIYHIGSASFVRTPESLARYKKLLKRNEAIFFAKWQVPRDYKSLSPDELLIWLGKDTKDQPLEKKDGSAVVVIPVFKPQLSSVETISLTQARRIWSKEKIVFVAPEGFTPDYGERSAGVRVEYFPAQYFTSVSAYSQLCLLDEFYARFSDYEYMLIYQLDAFAFTDRLAEFCALGFDYIGAPVPKFYKSWHILLDAQVGNGGFSLRRIAAVRKMLQYKELILRNHPMKAWLLVNEDMFFAYCGKKMYFQVADVQTALNFAVQDDVGNVYKRLEKRLPFGVHSWQTYPEIWRQHIEQAGYSWPGDISDLHPDRRKQVVEDYLRGRGKINLNYLYNALKWQEPLRALRMLLAWLEKYPQGDDAWRLTTEYLLDLWAKCVMEEERSEPDDVYLYELLEKVIAKAYIRSYYSKDIDVFFVLLLEHAKPMLQRLGDTALLQELAVLIPNSVKACEDAGFRTVARSIRNAYAEWFTSSGQ